MGDGQGRYRLMIIWSVAWVVLVLCAMVTLALVMRWGM